MVNGIKLLLIGVGLFLFGLFLLYVSNTGGGSIPKGAETYQSNNELQLTSILVDLTGFVIALTGLITAIAGLVKAIKSGDSVPKYSDEHKIKNH